MNTHTVHLESTCSDSILHDGVNQEMTDIGKRKYTNYVKNSLDSPLHLRRTSGTYSFGYIDMNSILRSAHFDRTLRKQQSQAELSQQEAARVVWFTFHPHIHILFR